MIFYYEINHRDNLTRCKTPCVLFVRNSDTYHWYEGWYAPDSDNILPKKLGEFIRDLWKNKKLNKALKDKMNNKERLDRIAEIIWDVDNRCLVADGLVTPTLEEMTPNEILEIYILATEAEEN